MISAAVGIDPSSGLVLALAQFAEHFGGVRALHV